MGYKLLITLRHPSTEQQESQSTTVDKPLVENGAESLKLKNGEEKPPETTNDASARNGKTDTTISSITASINVSSSETIVNGSKLTAVSTTTTLISASTESQPAPAAELTTQELLFIELADIFLKDLKNRVAGPAIHDYLKTARTKRLLEKETAATHTLERIDNHVEDQKMDVDVKKEQEKLIESILPSLGNKLPRFKKKQKSIIGRRTGYNDSYFYNENNNSSSETDLPATVSTKRALNTPPASIPSKKIKAEEDEKDEHEEREETPISTTSSSSEEGEYHSGPESVSDAELTPVTTTSRGRKPAAENIENRPRRLRDYLSEEESSADEHDAFLKQLHRQEEEQRLTESEEDDFVENDDPFEDLVTATKKRKRQTKKTSSIKKQKKSAAAWLHSEDEASELDYQPTTKLKKQKTPRKKKALPPPPPHPLPERIYEVIEEDLISKESSSGFEEEVDEEESEDNGDLGIPKVKETIDQAELERQLLADDESDSEYLAEPQNETEEPPDWNPLNVIQDPEDYCFLRAVYLERAGVTDQGELIML